MKQIRRILLGILSTFTLASLVFASSDSDGVRSKSFQVGKGGSLEISTGVGDIHIAVWEKNEVFVKAVGISDEDAEDLDMNQSGNTVRVEFRPEDGSSSHVRFDINVPSQFDIDIRTSGGDIEVLGSLTGTVKGSTSGGDIRLGNLRGKANMSTSGGDIETGDIEGNVNLKTSGGDIRMGTVGGDAEVSTAGGEISVRNVGKQLRAKTAGGNIEIGDVGGDASASTAGGNIRAGKVSGSASLSTAGGDIELRSATGTVKAKTAGGDLRLENVYGSVEGSTAGGNIQADIIPGNKGGSKLKTAGGDVNLSVPVDARATIKALIRIDRRNWKRYSDQFDIRSDFKLENYEKDEHSREIRATVNLNGGGELITLETAMGNIEIRKAK